ncbi:Uu.00g005390.m01.CDS01 [Anthostomella pinea]|uniref:Uu.00g005390.m01.CDS01 n=1 Tax=Anthostomella pinea TaxID=933095 RepID=A0AAI8VK57_9PEZI|nr:Uu.00g005390.m01.CDS01 [Anthostomella pinea]
MPGSEGHAAFQIAPTQGDNIIVPIEMYQGSKQADEKRQRNAGASARFRQRKKDREVQQAINIQKLEAQNREVEKRLQDAEAERDRYRAERDRLRDIVYRTPGTSELAFQGPPSPNSARSGGSFAERSPLVPATRPPTSMPIQQYGAADPTTGERASRRRRTDSQLEYSSHAYGSTPSTLPPIHQPSYPTTLSQPGTPSAGAPPRLPPLRSDPPSGTPTTAPSATNTPVQGYTPFKREPYESGWATRPSGPHDPGQR